MDIDVTAEAEAQALEIKARANKAFAGKFCLMPTYPTPSFWICRQVRALIFIDKDFNASIELYTEAIQLNPKDATFWNNRAMSKGKMEEHGGAIGDASEP